MLEENFLNYEIPKSQKAVFVSPQIRKLMKDENLKMHLKSMRNRLGKRFKDQLKGVYLRIKLKTIFYITYQEYI